MNPSDVEKIRALVESIIERDLKELEVLAKCESLRQDKTCKISGKLCCYRHTGLEVCPKVPENPEATQQPAKSDLTESEKDEILKHFLGNTKNVVADVYHDFVCQ